VNPEWRYEPFEAVVRSKGSGSSGLATSEWLDTGRYPVIGQGAQQVEGWTNREDLVLTPSPAMVLYGGHTRRAKYVDSPFVPGPNVKLLEPLSVLDSRFLFHYLNYLLVDSKGYADHFPLVRKSSVPLPPLPEQRRIVAILDEAFVGIATAKAHAERNLRNARAVFDDYLASVFLDHNLTWKSAPLEEHVRFIDYRGRTPEKTSEGFRLITAKNVKKGFVQLEPMEFVSPDSYAEWMTRGIPKAGDVLFTTEAPLGNVAQLDTDEHVVFAQRIIIMQADEAVLNSTFLKYVLLSAPLQARIHAQATGATAQGIKASLLKRIEIPIPPDVSEQRLIAARLDALDQSSIQLEDLYERKLAALDELKQALLHQAFSGQL
jgi:type I restriction enzyme, S subunit